MTNLETVQIPKPHILKDVYGHNEDQFMVFLTGCVKYITRSNFVEIFGEEETLDYEASAITCESEQTTLRIVKIMTQQEANAETTAKAELIANPKQ